MDALTGSGTVGNSWNVGTQTLTLGAAGGSGTFSGIIRGNGTGADGTSLEAGITGVLKTGAGTQVLSGANTYTGNTTINAGTLEIVQPVIATNSTVTVASGAVLQLDFAVTNIVQALVLNGTSQPSGVYNATTASPYITGTGSLQVGSLVSLNPATANFQMVSASGSLQFTWASDHQGWQLYTNAVGLDAAGNWFPVPGSASVTSENINLDPTQTNVFFQLRYP